jgi:hypothetical protein
MALAFTNPETLKYSTLLQNLAVMLTKAKRCHCSCMQHKCAWFHAEMLSRMQLIGTTPPKQINNGLVLQLCVKEGCKPLQEGEDTQSINQPICGELEHS